MVRRVKRYQEQPSEESFFDLSKDDEVIIKKELEEVKKHVTKEVKGGFIEAVSAREQKEKEDKEKESKENEIRRDKLNEAANVILSCLEPNSARDIRTAASDFKVNSIGIYVLGLLNRLIKTVDYYEPDIEAEWESGRVGYSPSIFCKYCNEEIEKPTNLKQVYCSNRCARRDRDFGKTGVIFPSDHSITPPETVADEKKWEQEQKRIGVI